MFEIFDFDSIHTFHMSVAQSLIADINFVNQHLIEYHYFFILLGLQSIKGKIAESNRSLASPVFAVLVIQEGSG